jgi:hypothetical protein
LLLVFALSPIRGLLETDHMTLKSTISDTLTERQRLERIAKLCEDLQAAVDRAGDHRRLLEQLKETAQELLTDAESHPEPRRKRR